MAQARTSQRGGEGRIGSGARVRGRIHGDGDLVVEGHVEGDITLRGSLTIASGGTVSSETVEADAAVIEGALDGDLSAAGKVRLAAGAQVRGNIRGSAIVIDEGARFSGRLDCEFDLPAGLEGASQPEGRGRAQSRR